MPALQTPDRMQLTLITCLDDFVAPDHPIRAFDALIDRIIDADPVFFDHLSPDGGVGRGGYAAECLIKLLLYGYLNQISSSRKLETEANRNVELFWLLKTLKPSYKTIADYRKDHPEQLARVNEQVVHFLDHAELIEGECVGIDGAKLKAYTGWDMPDQQSLDKRLEAAHADLEGWLTQLAINDACEDAAELLAQGEAEPEQAPASDPECMERIGQLHERIASLEAAKQRLAEAEVTRLPLSDPDARAMRAAHGGKPPAYNLQLAVDGAHKMIVVASVCNQANDFEQLTPMHQRVSQRLGRHPTELLADTGYADLGDIKAIQADTPTRCYIPENNSSSANRKITFSYDPDGDAFTCSQGRRLVPVAKDRYNKTKQAYMDRYRGTACGECPVAGQCTKAADGVRVLTVFHGAQWRHEYSRQLASAYGKQRIAVRKTLVEHVFGTLRNWMGQIPLKRRGMGNVQTEIDLYACAYNLKRWTSLAPATQLIAMVADWKPSPA